MIAPLILENLAFTTGPPPPPALPPPMFRADISLAILREWKDITYTLDSQNENNKKPIYLARAAGFGMGPPPPPSVEPAAFGAEEGREEEEGGGLKVTRPTRTGPEKKKKHSAGKTIVKEIFIF